MLYRTLITIFLILFFCLIEAQAQTTITINANSMNSIVQYIKADGTTDYQYTALDQIGRKNGSNGYYSGSQKDIYRSQYEFLLGTIPSNATLTQAKLNYSATGQCSTCKFTVTQTTGTKSWEALWSEIGSSTALEVDLGYTGFSRVSTSLLNAINSARSNGKIYLGALSQNEDINLTEATLGLSLEITYTVPPTTVTITADNNFTDNSGLGTHGQVSIDGSTQTVPSSGASLTRNVGQSLTLSAISPQQDNQSYQRTWYTGSISQSNWTKNGLQKSLNQSYSFQIAQDDNGTTYMANLRKVCQATFVKPDGNTTQNVIEGNTASAVTAPSLYTSSDWIYYNFVNWTWSGGSSTNTTITPTLTANTTYTANYTASTANPQPMNIHFTSTDGQYISLAWTDHPSTGVTQYQVWRYKEGGIPSAIATLNRGTTSFTDGAYIQNASGAVKLFYTVKAYYSPSGLWNDPGYYLNRGDIAPMIADDGTAEKIVSKEIPSGYSVSNYPNPFNPTTIINYQLPKDGFVTIKVYDVLGKEVATLVNENKSAGYYNISFDANSAGGGLTSGVYIYTINVNGFAQSKKMLLMK